MLTLELIQYSIILLKLDCGETNDWSNEIHQNIRRETGKSGNPNCAERRMED